MVRYDKVSKKRLVSNAGTVHNTNSTFIPKAKNGYDLSDRGAVKDIFILYFYIFIYLAAWHKQQNGQNLGMCVAHG